MLPLVSALGDLINFIISTKLFRIANERNIAGSLAICFHLGTYGHVALADGIPYVHQITAHKYLLPNKNATFPPMVQLKFGNYYVQFVNGTLMMGIESLEFVGEDDVQIHGKNFRIAGDKLLIGDETLVPKDGKEVLLGNGVTMQTNGTLTVGPERKSKDSSSCNAEKAMCGNHFFGDCCGGLRCKGGVCRKCPGRNERNNLLKCHYDHDCTECFGYGESFCILRNEKTKLRQCCLPPGYICEIDQDCCEKSYCLRGRCQNKQDCHVTDGAKCTHDKECCNAYECKSGKCKCKLGKECDEELDECCEGERCDTAIKKCVCANGVPCFGEENCCITQDCVNKFCTPCLGENEPCTSNGDCCSEGHCYKGHCRINFVSSIEVVHQDKYDVHKLPHTCLLENTNEGFGGKFVFVCPNFTANAKEAAVEFILDIGKCNHSRNDDLAEKAGGDCRYLNKIQSDDLYKIYQIGFSDTTLEKSKFDDTAGNVNQNRGGRNLFFNWHKIFLNPFHDFD